MRPRKVILCISSNVEEVSILRYMLDVRGYEAWIATTGQEAADFMTDGVDMVLCDCVLSDMTGSACIARLKEIAKHVPMVILARQFIDVEGFSADAVLLKSITANELLDRIHIMSVRKRGPRKGTPRPPRRVQS